MKTFPLTCPFFPFLFNLIDLVPQQSTVISWNYIRISSEGRNVFAVASDLCEDKLLSANGGTNIVFWEQLVSPLFQFLGCLEAVPT